MKLEDFLVGDSSHLLKRCDNTEQEGVKLEDILIKEDRNIEKMKKKRNLERELMKLRGELEDEQALNKALRTVLRGPVMSQPRLSLLLLPPQVQELIEEMATAEAEILCLEKRVEKLKMGVYHERKETEEREAEMMISQPQQQQQQQQKRLRRQNHIPPCETTSSEFSMKDDLQQRSKSQNYEEVMKDHKKKSVRTVSVGSVVELFAMTTRGKDEISELSRMHKGRTRNKCQFHKETRNGTPNAISEELIKCLVVIFLELNRISREGQGTPTVSKLSLTYLKSASFNRKSGLSPYDRNASNLDPYGVMINGMIRDIGPYKDFIHITRGSIDVSRLSDCSTATVKLRVLIEKLHNVSLCSLTFKHKLAFWINIYNACIMNAFLEQGLPSSQEKLLALMNKATINVGGTVLNAQVIEHFILRHPFEHQESVSMDDKETQLQQAYGLAYSEPNLTFALCRGTWSSPALRVYTPDEVVNDLGRARAEYLDAAIGVSSRRKIVVSHMLRRHMPQFADDVEALLEWVLGQLPASCLSLKEAITECLKRKELMAKMVETRPYEYEFRYLLPL